MNLLMTVDTLGGVWTYGVELCRALKGTGVNISLATMGRKLSPSQRAEVDVLDHVRLYESDYRLCWMPDPWKDVERAGEWLLGIARECDADLIHLNDLAHGVLDWPAPVLLVGHSCVLSWWEAVKGEPAPDSEWRTYRQVLRRSVQQADMVAAPTKAMLKALLHHYGRVERSRVITNGRDFPALVQGAELLKREEMIFAAGRLWDQAKNIGMLSSISSSLPWPVYVAGDEGQEDFSAVNNLGFLDPDKLAGWLRRAAIFAAPALYEPFGLGILEAARSGCALVLGDIDSLREVWGEAAVYVDPHSEASLQEGLISLIKDPQWRQRMAWKARKRAENYTTSRMAGDYLRCYDVLLDRTYSEVR